MASSATDVSSLDSEMVIMSLETINSSASNHLDRRLLQFHAHSQTVLVVAFGPALVFWAFRGTVCQLSVESVSMA